MKIQNPPFADTKPPRFGVDRTRGCRRRPAFARTFLVFLAVFPLLATCFPAGNVLHFSPMLTAQCQTPVFIPAGDADRTVSLWYYSPLTQTAPLVTWDDGGNLCSPSSFTVGFGPQTYSFGACSQFLPVFGPFPEVNAWNHVAVTWNRSDTLFRFYLNGNEIFNGSLVGLNSKSNVLRLGSFYGDVPMNAYADDIRIYNRTLSAQEVFADMVSPQPGLVAWYDGLSSNLVLLDRSASNNHAIMTSALLVVENPFPFEPTSSSMVESTPSSAGETTLFVSDATTTTESATASWIYVLIALLLLACSIALGIGVVVVLCRRRQDQLKNNRVAKELYEGAHELRDMIGFGNRHKRASADPHATRRTKKRSHQGSSSSGSSGGQTISNLLANLPQKFILDEPMPGEVIDSLMLPGTLMLTVVRPEFKSVPLERPAEVGRLEQYDVVPAISSRALPTRPSSPPPSHTPGHFAPKPFVPVPGAYMPVKHYTTLKLEAVASLVGTQTSWSSEASTESDLSASSVNLLEAIDKKVRAGVFRGCAVAVKTVASVDVANPWKLLDHHYNVLQLIGVVPSTKSLVMEFCGGGNLLEYLQTQPDGTVPLTTLLSFMAQAAEGVCHIHSYNIAHGDLACRHLLLAGDGSVKVAMPTTTPTTTPAPKRWMPANCKTKSMASDVWAFGVVMWEIVSQGKVPSTEVLPPRVRGCSPATYRLMNRCWTEDATSRVKMPEVRNELKGLNPLSLLPGSAPKSPSASLSSSLRVADQLAAALSLSPTKKLAVRNPASSLKPAVLPSSAATPASSPAPQNISLPPRSLRPLPSPSTPSRPVAPALVHVLFSSPEFMDALLEQDSDMDAIARCLLSVYGSQGKMSECLCAGLAFDLARSSAIGDVFRLNSVASKMLAVVASKVGNGFVSEALEVPVAAASKETRPFEVDPAKGKLGSPSVVLEQAQRFLDGIAVATVPEDTRWICAEIAKQVGSKFPGESYLSVVGGFLFHRWLMPALAAVSVPSPEARRLLVLVSKVLSNLADTRTVVGKNYMSFATPWLEHQQGKMTMFLELACAGGVLTDFKGGIDAFEFLQQYVTDHWSRLGLPDSLEKKIRDALPGVQLSSSDRRARSVSPSLRHPPTSERSEAWQSKLQIAVFSKCMFEPEDKNVREQIAKDVRRTLPGLPEFQTEDMLDSLHNVLWALANYDPEVGYCQGMNYIGGCFLYHLKDEETTFQSVVRLMKAHDLRRLYLPGFPGLYENLFVFEALFKKKLQKLWKKFKALEIEPVMYAQDWFQTLFVRTFGGRMEVVGPVWDKFVEDGWVVLHGVGLALLGLNEEKLMTLDFEEIVMGFNTMGDGVDVVALMKKAGEFDLKGKTIETLGKEHAKSSLKTAGKQ